MAKTGKSADYTAETGLKVLEYLGITAVTEEEKKLFRKKWTEFYDGKRNDVVMATWELYSGVLPFTLNQKDEGRQAFVIHMLRDGDFGDRVEKTKLIERLEKGIPLEMILKEKPLKVFVEVELRETIAG